MSQKITVSGLLPVLLMVATMAQAFELPAALQYERVVELSVPVSGVVNRVLAEEGQTVAKGDLLLELEATPFTARLEKISADIRFLKAERDVAEKDLQRNEELYKRMVLSTVSLDGSRLGFIRADSLWDAKKAEYVLANYEYEKSQLAAPFAGKIIDRLVEPGQSIRVDMQSPVLFRLADTSVLVAEAEVTGDKIGSIGYGIELEVRIQGKVYSAVVKSIALLSPGRSLSQPARYRIRVRLNETGFDLLPGQAVTLILPGADAP